MCRATPSPGAVVVVVAYLTKLAITATYDRLLGRLVALKFAPPSENGVRDHGLYRVSTNSFQSPASAHASSAAATTRSASAVASPAAATTFALDTSIC